MTTSLSFDRLRTFGFLVLLVGCAPKTPDKVADRFVDLYFVEIDQRRVLPLTSGLAHQKIEEELALVENIRKTYVPDQAKPKIFWTRRSGDQSDDHARYSYDLTIRQGRDQTDRSALISVERVDGRWTVANFMVREGHLPERPASR
jgi:hypothetical protein